MSDRQTETTTREPVRRGFGALPCPCCQADGLISVDLADMTGDCFKCAECDGVFCMGFVRDLIAKWQRVLDWLDTAPRLED